MFIRDCKLLAIILTFICTQINSHARASEPPPPTKSVRALVDDSSNVSNHFGAAADYNLRNGQIDQALETSRKALRRDPDNIEAHVYYAEALERKLVSLKEADPDLMKECISEWLVVYRSEVGEEKGLGFHGISVMGHLFEDEGYAIRARQRLKAIAGRAPHPWETNARYLKNVLRNASVSGKIIGRK
ncbi:MAG: tetratricopeptide repeat protein [Candidatus Obscuribacterales bacterium]|nr:tetratricopeptide repeat protein [Cyanobacteria bacterium SZAS LIN-5]RTL44526.1 MAG: tetratricopeptide repeat protein [Candidatus Melainabacteria bacterium]